jgi:hypothetical protein
MELSLFSSLFAEKVQSIFSEYVHEKGGPPTYLGQLENDNLAQYSINKSAATEFSNASLSDDGYRGVNVC